jgi:anti-anti-sigma regulatory factor
MDLNISNNQIGDVSLVALRGRIVLGEGSSSLRERIKSLIGDGKKKIVLNMANVTYIDTAKLGRLVAIRHFLRLRPNLRPPLSRRLGNWHQTHCER